MSKSCLVFQLSFIVLASFAAVTGMVCYYALIQPPLTTTIPTTTTAEPETFGLGAPISLFSLSNCVTEYSGNLEETQQYIEQQTLPTLNGQGCVPVQPPASFTFNQVSPAVLTRRKKTPRSAFNFPLNTFISEYAVNLTVPSLTHFSGDLDDRLRLAVITNPPFGYTLLPGNISVASSCFPSVGYSQAMIDFDEETRDMVSAVVSPDGTTICIERASNATNYTSFAWAGYYTAMAQTTNASFDFHVWGDYYIMNWPLSNISLAVDKTQPLIHYGFLNVRHNAIALEQGNSLRGSLITSLAPCGIYLSYDAMTQQLTAELCGSPFAITQTRSWFLQGLVAPPPSSCQCVNDQPEISDYSDDVMATYMKFSMEERIAFAVTQTEPKRVFWYELVNLSPDPISLVMHPLTSSGISWGPSLAYDCRRNLAVTYYGLDSLQVLNYVTYRSRTDPEDEMRDPVIYAQVPLQPLRPSFIQPFDHLTFFGVHPTSSTGITVNFLRIANETLQYQWTVVDGCGYTANCPPTTIHLGNKDSVCY